MDVFDLFAKLSLDTSNYDKELGSAEQKASSFGGAFESVGKAVGNGLATVAKVGVAAVGTASAAIGALTTKSVEAYSEYEQLVGGVQKLYGNMGQSLEEYAAAQGQSVDEAKAKWQELEDAQNLVQENAKNAYRTAGMSMNEYMDTATSFSAALINSLGGDTLKAAEQTDVAMRAISDNFNTFGGDIEGVKNAFMGFAKQNYTMLDNLKLGYGGTKQGMEQLIADANEYAKSIGQAGDLTIDSFSDIVTAIDLVQQKQNIAGTTAREAATTIQGSLGMVTSAWENLLTGMADGEADMDALMGNLVDSIAGTTDEAGNHINGLLDNIIPVAETAISNIGSLIEKIAPIIGEKLPEILGNIAPSLISAGASLVGSIVKGVTENLPAFIESLQSILSDVLSSIKMDDADGLFDSILGLILDIADKLPDAATVLIDAALDLIDRIIKKLSDTSTLSKLISAGVNLVVSLGNGLIKAIPKLVKMIPQLISCLVSAITENLPIVLDGILELVNGIVTELPNLILAIGEALPELIQTLADYLVTNLPILINGIVTMIDMIAQNLPTIIDAIITILPDLIESIVNALIECAPVLIQGTVTLITALAQHLPEICMVLIEAIPQIIAAILDAFKPVVDGLGLMFKDAWEKVKEAFAKAPEWFKSIFETAKSNIKDSFDKVKDNMSKVWQSIKDVFAKVGTWFKDRFNEAKNNITDVFKTIGEFFAGVWEDIKNAFNIAEALQWGKDLLANFVNGIKDGLVNLKDELVGVGKTIQNYIGFSEPKDGPLSNFHTYAPDMMKLFADGIKSNTGIVTDAIEDAFDFKNAITVPQVNASYSGTTTNDGIYLKKMVELLQQVVDNGMSVELEGDAAELFKVVERENRITTKATGFNKLSMLRV